MTQETRHLIEVADILGVEFECKNCKAKIVLSTEATKTIFMNCPVCNHEWLCEDTEEARSLRSFLNLLLKTLDKNLQGRSFSLRLQIIWLSGRVQP